MPEDRESTCLTDHRIRGPHGDAAIAALAAGQHGVVSRGELLDAGVTATMIVQLTKVLGEAERQRVLDVNGIEEAIGRLRGRRGSSVARVRTALRELEDYGATLTRSRLEDHFLPLLDARDLPRPATNVYVEGCEADAVWHRQRLIVELDGWAWHNTRRAFQRDRDKSNLWTGRGWTVLRFTHADVVRRPEVVLAGVRNELSRAAESAPPPRAAARPA